MTVLVTERLTLRPVTGDDFTALAAMWAEPAVTRYITGKPMGAEEVWFRLLRDVGHWQTLGHGNWVVRDKAGDLVGTVGIFDYRRDLVPPFTSHEIGWAIVTAQQGKGYAYEAVSAVLEHADHVLAYCRTVCMISAENTASVRLANRCGYEAYGDGLYKGQPVVLFERAVPPQNEPS